MPATADRGQVGKRWRAVPWDLASHAGRAASGPDPRVLVAADQPSRAARRGHVAEPADALPDEELICAGHDPRGARVRDVPRETTELAAAPKLLHRSDRDTLDPRATRRCPRPGTLARLPAAAPNAGVLVVDDASPDGTGDLATTAGPPRTRACTCGNPAGKEGLGAAYVGGSGEPPRRARASFELARRADVVVAWQRSGQPALSRHGGVPARPSVSARPCAQSAQGRGHLPAMPVRGTTCSATGAPTSQFSRTSLARPIRRRWLDRNSADPVRAGRHAARIPLSPPVPRETSKPSGAATAMSFTRTAV